MSQKMDIKRKRFQRIFPNLAREINSRESRTKINSVRSDPTTGDKVTSKKFTDYTPDVIDFLRRCDKTEQAIEIIDYLEKRKEISSKFAKKIRKQLRERGVRSFGSKKEDDYYLKQSRF
jgi:hypothetical protein